MPSASVSPSLARRVFITTQSYNGNLGGLSGGDAKCQSAADSVSLGGKWKAWLSTSSISASSRLEQAAVPYKLLNGSVVANNWTDLADGSLQNPINITEQNKVFPQAGIPVWTGTKENGSSAEFNCTDWTSSANGGTTTNQYYGGSGATLVSFWSNSGNRQCSGAYPLFCVEQVEAALPVVDGKRADLYNDPKKPNFVNDQDVSVFYTKCAADGLEFFGKPASVQPVCDILEDGKITAADWAVLIKFRNQTVQ